MNDYNDSDLMGECDSCDEQYDVSSRDGRCGDCGDCGNCCIHLDCETCGNPTNRDTREAYCYKCDESFGAI